MTQETLIDELDRAVKVPGLANFWVPPIRNRIEMLSTGIKSPIGVKVAGANLADIDRVAREIETVAKTVPGIASALAERLTGGRYIDIKIDRGAAARYGNEYRRRPVDRLGRDRRRDCWTNGGGPGALPDQRPLPA
jgi:Cu(I)/Ag(I) efflux system membrane protein CusA/SilA